jgi:hypothetical protein
VPQGSLQHLKEVSGVIELRISDSLPLLPSWISSFYIYRLVVSYFAFASKNTRKGTFLGDTLTRSDS